MVFCDNCGRASALRMELCLGCGMNRPAWQCEKIPWRLTRWDALFLKALWIDPEVDLGLPQVR